MSNRLENKIAIVVGGTSGIGKAITELYAAEGAKVVMTGRREEKGREIEKAINDNGGECLFIQADSTKKEDLEKVVNTTIEKYGRIDILNNNAGILATTPLDEIDPTEEFNHMFNVNVTSYLTMIQLVAPYMKKQGAGSIINTASVGARQPMPFNISYSTSKAAVKHMTESMAVALAGDNIRVNSLAPGLTRSEMVEEGSDFEKAVLPSVPMKRTGSAKEIANGSLFLASDEASYVSGHMLVLDGALTAFSC